MFGFYAMAVSFDIKIDKNEIADAKWFTRSKRYESKRQRILTLPPNVPIACNLF
jgi:NADH pyrophosphatase NudC (nudix superfamily)